MSDIEFCLYGDVIAERVIRLMEIASFSTQTVLICRHTKEFSGIDVPTKIVKYFNVQIYEKTEQQPGHITLCPTKNLFSDEIYSCFFAYDVYVCICFDIGAEDGYKDE